MNKYHLAGRHLVNYGLQQLHLKTGWNVGKPTAIYASLSPRCFLKCKHCNFWNMEHNQPLELTTEEWFKTIDGLVEWLGVGFKINFTGGEPFIRPDCLDILRYAVQKGALTGVVSNGARLVAPKVAKALVESGVFNVNFSVDGFTPQTHNLVRGVDGSHKAVLTALENVDGFRKELNRNLRLVVKNVILKHNYHEMEPLADWVKDKGYTGVMFQPLQQNFGEYPRPGWHLNNPLWLTKEDLPKVSEILKRLADKASRGWPILNGPENLMSMVPYFENPDAPPPHGGTCEVGITNFNIYDDGSVSLCYKMETVGNVRQQTPEAIWHSHMAKERREEIRGCKANCMVTCQVKRSLTEKGRLFLAVMQ